MNDSLPTELDRIFSVKRIGKINAACCRLCTYRVDFFRFPLTPNTNAKLGRHVKYHVAYRDSPPVLGVVTDSPAAGEPSM